MNKLQNRPVLIDFGSAYIKCGFVGEENPRHIEQTKYITASGLQVGYTRRKVIDPSYARRNRLITAKKNGYLPLVCCFPRSSSKSCLCHPRTNKLSFVRTYSSLISWNQPCKRRSLLSFAYAVKEQPINWLLVQANNICIDRAPCFVSYLQEDGVDRGLWLHWHHSRPRTCRHRLSLINRYSWVVSWHTLLEREILADFIWIGSWNLTSNPNL